MFALFEFERSLGFSDRPYWLIGASSKKRGKCNVEKIRVVLDMSMGNESRHSTDHDDEKMTVQVYGVHHGILKNLFNRLSLSGARVRSACCSQSYCRISGQGQMNAAVERGA